MAVETTPLGFKAPDGNELVRNGDNHIADNARKAEELIAADRGRLSAIESKNTAQDTRLDGVESKNTQQDGRLTNAETRLGNAETAATSLTGRVTATENKNTAQDTRLAAVETKNAVQDTTLNNHGPRITTAEAKNNAQDSTIANHSSRIGSLETIGGLAPGDVSDATVTDLIANPSSTTAIELGGKFVNRGMINYAKDTLVGDGVTNEFTKLQTLFNLGGVIVMEKGKVYAYTPTATLTLPDGTTLLTNGAAFKELTSKGDTSTFRVNGETYIDSLRLDLAGGDTARGLLVAGDNTTIENVYVKARALSGLGNWRRRGLVVGIEGVGSKNVRIGRAWVENWDYSVAVFDSERITFDSLHMRNSRQGLLANDVVGLSINSGTDEVMSPNATGGPGENSIIVGSTRGHHTFRGLTVSNFVSRDASEHAFRVGGQFQAKDIWFTRCKAVGAGAGLGSGGCGFKALGATSIMDSSAKHSNIHFTDCIVENSKNFLGANTEAFHVAKCRNVVINNPIVRAASVPPSYSEGTNSAYHGIRLFGVEKVTINNPQIEKCLQHGIWIQDIADDAVTNNGGGNGNIYIRGGILGQNQNHIYIDTPSTARRIVVDTTTDGGSYSVYATPTSVLNRCTFEVNSYSATVANFIGLAGATTILRGDIVGTPSGRGGSTYTDYATGRTYLNSSGWKVQGLSGTTANRPTTGVVGDEYYDTTLGKKIWVKSLNPLVWADASGAAA